MDTPDTPAQAKAREEYRDACAELSTATYALVEAKRAQEEAFQRYAIAYGAARQAGVIK